MNRTSFPFPGLRAALLVFGLIAQPGVAQENEEGRLPLDELRTFADVFNQIRIGYVEEIDDSALL
ncbi:MAG: peptidase S41, partial [Haliea sp.]